MRTNRRACWVATVGAAALAGGATAEHRDPASLPLLPNEGVQLYVQEAYEGFPEDVTAAVAGRRAELVEAGMRGARHLFDWADLEPAPGEYDLDLASEALDERIEQGLPRQFVNISVIDSFGPERVPAYVEDLLASGARWDDPRIVGPFLALLDAIVPIMVDRGVYMVGFANEPGGYYEDRPAEAASFAGFVAAAIEHAQTIEPELAGTVVFAGADDASIPSLMPLIDVATFNAYAYRWVDESRCSLDGATFPALRPLGPREIGPLLDELVAASGGRLICIQEFGQSTGWEDRPTTLGPEAGPERQRAMLKGLAIALSARRAHFRTVCLWTLNDHTPAGVQYLVDAITAAGLPACFGEHMAEVFGPTGLVYSDAKATTKPAFEAFKHAIRHVQQDARGRGRPLTPAGP